METDSEKAKGIELMKEIQVTGELTDTRRRFLGAKPPKLYKIEIEGESVSKHKEILQCFLFLQVSFRRYRR